MKAILGLFIMGLAIIVFLGLISLDKIEAQSTLISYFANTTGTVNNSLCWLGICSNSDFARRSQDNTFTGVNWFQNTLLASGGVTINGADFQVLNAHTYFDLFFGQFIFMKGNDCSDACTSWNMDNSDGDNTLKLPVITNGQTLTLATLEGEDEIFTGNKQFEGDNGFTGLNVFLGDTILNAVSFIGSVTGLPRINPFNQDLNITSNVTFNRASFDDMTLANKLSLQTDEELFIYGDTASSSNRKGYFVMRNDGVNQTGIILTENNTGSSVSDRIEFLGGQGIIDFVMNITGLWTNKNITSDHRTYNWTGSIDFNTTYTNSNSRTLDLTLTYDSLLLNCQDTTQIIGYRNGEYFSEAYNEIQCDGFTTIAERRRNTMTLQVNPGETYSFNSTKTAGGVITKLKVMGVYL